MECSDIAVVYKRRKPQETSLWKLLDYHFLEFEEHYDELFQKQYGFYRPVISHVVRKYLECGDLHQGFARIKCPTAIMNLFWHFPVEEDGFAQVAITRKWYSSGTISKRRFFILFPIGNMYFPFQKF